MHFRRLWSFQTWCRKSLAAPSTVTVVCVRIKCAHFDTESTTVITALCPEEKRSSTTKSTLSMSHRKSRIQRGCNLLTRACLISFVLRHRSQVLMYCPMYLDICKGTPHTWLRSPLSPNLISLYSPWLPKNGMQGHFSIYIVDYSLQEPHLILWGISWR